MPLEVTKEGAAKLLGKLAEEQKAKIKPFSTPKFLNETGNPVEAKALTKLVPHPSSRLIRVLSNLKDKARSDAKPPIGEDAFWKIQGLTAGGAYEAMADQVMINRKVLGDRSVEDVNGPRGRIYLSGPSTLRFWEYIYGGRIFKHPNFGIWFIQQKRGTTLRYTSDALELDWHLNVTRLIEHTLDPGEGYVQKKLNQLDLLQADPKLGKIFEQSELQLVVPGREQQKDHHFLRSIQDPIQRVLAAAYHTGFDNSQMMDYVGTFLMPPRPAVFARQTVDNPGYSRRTRR